MNRPFLRSLILCGLPVLLMALPVLVVASEDQPGNTPSAESVQQRAEQQLPDDFVNTADIAMVLDDEGTLSLAGVVGLDVDEAGRTVVEISRSGDFDVDPVLTFDLPLLTDAEGNEVIGGFAKISFRSETVVITLDEEGTEREGAAGSGTCHLGATLPSLELKCLGDCDDIAESCIFQTEIVKRLRPAEDPSHLPLGHVTPGEMPAIEPGYTIAAVEVEVAVVCGCVDLDP